MKPSELLLSFSLIIAAFSPLLFLTFLMVREQRQSRKFMESLWKTESMRVQTMLNMAAARDFQTFAGMQSLTHQGPGTQSQSNPQILSSTSEYIPRDDITEAFRMRAFGTPGYGEAIFDEDPELAEALSDLVANGHVDFGEEDSRE